MKIAIIGGGISGMGAALALGECHDVTLFEAADRLGGHANTVTARFGERQVPVDTGFIVYNYRNYPNLTGLFEHLGVPTKWSDMSFGFSLAGGTFEYACDDLDKLFAQRWRALDPRHIAMLRQILRFMKSAPGALESGALDGLSMREYLDREGYGGWFRERFILPMGAAIWSTPTGGMLDFPARNFVNFFVNHDLMTGLDAAQKWRTVDGGSREYVRRVAQVLGDRVRPGREVVEAGAGGLLFADGSEERFDQIVFACHAPDALRLSASQLDREQLAVLSRFRTSQNRAILHSDPRLMPNRRKVWSSWSVLDTGDATRPVQLSYWMNRLQSIPEETPLFVTLNPVIEPDPALLHSVHDYAHPVYDRAAFEAQADMDMVQGRGGLWFAGAWLGYGFHEDGLRSGLRVAEALGARPPWARDTGTPLRPALAHAAE